MKKMIFAFAFAMGMVTCGQGFAYGCHNEVYVEGYYRDNGVYVQPHYRTRPNNTQRDNWSSWPNVNPHTGRWGTRIPRY